MTKVVTFELGTICIVDNKWMDPSVDHFLLVILELEENLDTLDTIFLILL